MKNIQVVGENPRVGMIMGSVSDWKTMQFCAARLEDLGISYEKRVISAHRTPDLAHEYASSAEARGLKLVIAAAGGAAHLAGVIAAFTHLPVIGCPMMGWSTDGLDSLLSMANMPAGIPVLTMSVGKAGAINAAMASAAILALSDPDLNKRLLAYRSKASAQVMETLLPEVDRSQTS
jgi:5-(carboxyamino)imidazole ribonucleotide mutase